MLRANRPIVAFFDAIKNLRIRQLALILKAGYEPNLMLNARGQNGLQFMVNYFGATDAHFRLQVPLNKSTYLSMAKLMLDSGLDPNATDLLTDETVLFDAIRFDDREMVALLLNYVDLSLRNKNGETALMCAARFGSKQVTRMLLDHLRHLEMDGYFLRQRNRFGMSALELARAENLEAAKVLTKHLIAYGHHTGAVLARSMSHHQLVDQGGSTGRASYQPPGAVAAAAAGFLRAGPPGAPVDVADCYSLASDFSDGELFGAPPPAPSRAAALPRQRLGAGRPNYRPYVDPRAAEFSAYLLEQQEQQLAEGGASRGFARAAGSDEDEYGPTVAGNGRAPAPGPLMRSRSCMLAPPGQQGAKQTSMTPGGQKRSSAGGPVSSAARSGAM